MKMGRIAAMTCALLAISCVAYAHEGGGITGGFLSGIL